MITQRVQKYTITKNNIFYKICDELCLKSKNLYNYANYILRQEFINNNNYIKYKDLTFQLKHSAPFKDLGSNSSQHTLRILDKAWKSFFVSIKDWAKNPSKYLGKPKLPKYKDKVGRHICILTNWQSQIKDGYLYFAFTPLKPYNKLIKVNIQGKHLQTRIVPKGSCYVLEVVYEKNVEEITGVSKNIASIDLGLNNFATISNNIGAKSIVINGKGIKSYNKYWNKQMSYFRSILKKNNGEHWSNKLGQLTQKRNNKMEYFMHCASKAVINYCLNYNIDTLIVGYNKEWKQESNLSKIINQSFVQIPYENFISKLKYKCEDYGIKFILNNEMYTSGTSFIDGEEAIKENYNKKRRCYRGLFISNAGIKINADLNGAYQIMKKVFPNAFANGIKGADFHPLVVNVI